MECENCEVAIGSYVYNCRCGYFCDNVCLTNHTCSKQVPSKNQCSWCNIDHDKYDVRDSEDNKKLAKFEKKKCDHCNNIFCSEPCLNNHQCAKKHELRKNMCSCTVCMATIKPVGCKASCFGLYSNGCLAAIAESCQMCQTHIPLDDSTAIFWFDHTTIPAGRATRGHISRPSENNGFLCLECQKEAIYSSKGHLPTRVTGNNDKVAIRHNSSHTFFEELLQACPPGSDAVFHHTRIPSRKTPMRIRIFIEEKFIRDGPIPDFFLNKQKELEEKVRQHDSRLVLTYENILQLIILYGEKCRVSLAQMMKIMTFPLTGDVIQSITFKIDVYDGPVHKRYKEMLEQFRLIRITRMAAFYEEIVEGSPTIRAIRQKKIHDSLEVAKPKYKLVLPIDLQNVVYDYIDFTNTICILHNNKKIHIDCPI
ncbi:MAG: hypothetical protein Edafosvirus2_68 [Edafosvirus sp.]|uniref:C2H2-type domain-containing protein n=1 Tax=Edafosvirus sp. TaxID=2487765 RepID=A0A3G4ZWT8_9VIRU|nr:MAG: hypothetical protein Edafosvirus2_68 [Edafosvirus sp.]